MNPNELQPKDQLDKWGLDYKERNGELITACPISDCDQDSRPNEAHFYISSETGQYHCKKCGESGNMLTLAKAIGKEVENLSKPKPKSSKPPSEELTDDIIANCQKQLPQDIRKWLNQRGITNENIEDYQIGVGSFYGRDWITIPVRNRSGDALFLKLRSLPDDRENTNKYMFWPTGSSSVLFNLQNINLDENLLLLCEGEFDCIIAQNQGFPAVTSTAGAGTFDMEWLDGFDDLKDIYIAFDNDDAGNRGAVTVADKLAQKLPNASVYQVELSEGTDLTEYFISNNGTPDDIVGPLSKHVAGLRPIDTDSFEPMSAEELTEILGLTIKRDEQNKLVTFLCQLSAYTDNSQLNLSFNAPSSSGKSFIPMEIAKLFPQSDVMELGYASPTSFFHSSWNYDKEKKEFVVDLSRKIIIFLDQPHTMLLEHLRPLLSHDKKEIRIQITDKQQKHGLRAKKIVLKGFPAVIFCSAGLRLDEQEATRFLLLSPEITQEKIREGVIESLAKDANPKDYADKLDANPKRGLLKDRIEAIKREDVKDILIDEVEQVQNRFLSGTKSLKPRHQRDIKRLVSLIKIFALLNLWWRERDGDVIRANNDDIKAAFNIWEKIAYIQELNIPPYVYRLYEDIILAVFADKNGGRSSEFADITGALGVSRQEILTKHYEVYGRMLNSTLLRQQILPMLEQAGLISQEKDPNDKRNKLIFPQSIDKYSESDGGVSDEIKLDNIEIEEIDFDEIFPNKPVKS